MFLAVWFYLNGNASLKNETSLTAVYQNGKRNGVAVPHEELFSLILSHQASGKKNTLRCTNFLWNSKNYITPPKQ